MNWPILSIVTFLPLLGALLILLLRGDGRIRAQQRALDRAVDHARHLRALAACCGATSIRPSPRSSSSRSTHWLGGGITYHMGVDGISMLFVVLTAFLMPFCILASWAVDPERGCANT